MILLNSAKRGGRWQVLLDLPRVEIGWELSPREWWAEGVRRRGRGPYPRSGPWPIFRYVVLGPLVIRRFTDESRRHGPRGLARGRFGSRRG